MELGQVIEPFNIWCYNKLYDLRMDAGLTREELCIAAGIPVAENNSEFPLLLYEVDGDAVPDDMLLLLSDFFKISSEELIAPRKILYEGA